MHYQLRKYLSKIEKFTDVCMTRSIMHTPSYKNVCKFFNFHTMCFLVKRLANKPGQNQVETAVHGCKFGLYHAVVP